VRVEGRRAKFDAHVEPPSDAQVDATALFAAAARKAGWRTVDAAMPYLLATKTIRGSEWWIHGMCFGSADCRMVLMQKAPRPVVLKPDPPKPGEAKLPGDNEDFPYLGRWPGAKLVGANGDAGNIDATPDDATEPTIVGPGVIHSYELAKPISAYEFVVTYR